MSFCVWLLSLKHSVFKVHPHCSTYQNFTLWMNHGVFMHIECRILTVCRFRICELAFWLHLFINSRVNTWSTFLVIGRHAQSSNKFESSCTFQQKLLSCFSSHTVNECAFYSLFNAVFFAFLCFSLVISLAKMTPKHSAKVQSWGCKCKKAVMCLREKYTC